VAPWPEGLEAWIDEQAEADFAAFQSLIVETRRLRKEYGVGEGQRVALHVTGGPRGFSEAVAGQGAALDQLARVDRLETGPGAGVGANAVLPNGAELFLPLEGVIDVERERARMKAEIEKLEGLLAGVRARLGNEQFVSNAPEAVVAKARENQAQLEDQSGKLREKLAGFGG
jgi:valyl-tRNA synthetase